MPVSLFFGLDSVIFFSSLRLNVRAREREGVKKEEGEEKEERIKHCFEETVSGYAYAYFHFFFRRPKALLYFPTFT